MRLPDAAAHSTLLLRLSMRRPGLNLQTNTMHRLKRKNDLQATYGTTRYVKRASPQDDANEVVPGDVILLGAGRRVPADGRLIEAYGLAIDESALTGESVPVEKEAELVLPESTPLAERHNLTFAGTVVVRGRGTAIVTATAMQTEIGRIAGVAREVKAPRTPLQVAMGELSRSLVWIALGFSLVVPLLALLFGSLYLQQAIVKRLQAVETLGSVTVIATDKTGTLTRNQMVVDRFFPEKLDRKMLEVGAICNDATGTSKLIANDPLEAALLLAAREKGIDVEEIRRILPLRDEFTFDNSRKLMSVIYERDGMLWSAVKGAPEALLVRATSLATPTGEHPLTEAEKQAMLTMASQMADDNFATIVHAIEEGRILFKNLQKGVRYYLACKVALVAVTLLPVLLRVPVPFSPVQ